MASQGRLQAAAAAVTAAETEVTVVTTDQEKAQAQQVSRGCY